jgi:hypothetical protein
MKIFETTTNYSEKENDKGDTPFAFLPINTEYGAENYGVNNVVT